jgi:hypothetical protein
LIAWLAQEEKQRRERRCSFEIAGEINSALLVAVGVAALLTTTLLVFRFSLAVLVGVAALLPAALLVLALLVLVVVLMAGLALIFVSHVGISCSF